jgi:hypothetical protein
MRLLNGGCSVAPSGAEGCDWWSKLPRQTDPSSAFFVTQYTLAPQAPLVIVSPEDAIIVTADDAVLLDETQVPHGNINASKGTVLLVPKGKRTTLRNVGDKGLLVVEIVIHKSSQ